MKINQQNSTESTRRFAPQQTEVIAALMRGATVTDATRQAEVDRTTFYLWLKSDANFVAELNRAKREQLDALRGQLRGVADLALSTVREMLTSKDVPAALKLKAALNVLQSVGSLEPEGIGATDPVEIEADLLFQRMNILG